MLLKNCKIITPEGVKDGDILIEGEKIASIGKDLKGTGVINVKGKLVIPGIIDAHVHMRDFDQAYKEDFISGSKAAIAGGVTTFIDMPNSSPPVTDEKIFNRRLEEAKRKSFADFGLNFGITPENLGETAKVSPTAYKIYLDGALGEITDNILREAIEKCKKVAVHAEDSTIIKKNLGRFKDNDFSIHGKIREPLAEEKAVEKVSDIASTLEKSVHICHISCREALAHLNKFTTCEVTPHHLLLTEKDLKEMEGIAKTNPPLRPSSHGKALWAALKAGKINIIVSDHAPHAEDEKEEDVLNAPSGIPNLDVMLRLFLTLVNKGKLSIQKTVRLMCKNPADTFGLNKGEIIEGKDADLLILNMEEKGRIEADEFYSKAKYSPFEGWRTKGNLEKVILRGNTVFEDGDFTVKKGYGKWIGGR